LKISSTIFCSGIFLFTKAVLFSIVFHISFLLSHTLFKASIQSLGIHFLFQADSIHSLILFLYISILAHVSFHTILGLNPLCIKSSDFAISTHFTFISLKGCIIGFCHTTHLNCLGHSSTLLTTFLIIVGIVVFCFHKIGACFIHCSNVCHTGHQAKGLTGALGVIHV